MSIVKACKVSSTLKNTGVDCEISMGATAMFIAVPKLYKFTDTDLLDPLAWYKGLIHNPKATRGYPLFGLSAPIRYITNNKGADIIVEMDDGSKQFVRYGFLNRDFSTTSGGLCYANALQSFTQSGYSILEIDQQGRMMARLNSDKSYSGLITDFMYSPSPDLADFKNPQKTNFSLSMSPIEYVNNGVILVSTQDELFDILGIGGLNDAFFSASALPSTTTLLKLNLTSECSGDDLIASLGDLLEDPTNYVVTNHATGAVIPITAATIVGTHLELTGVFVSGQKYDVVGAGTDVLFANDIDGYDFNISVTITIP